MEITHEQILALINQLIATNTTGDVTALDVRTVMEQQSLYTQQTATMLNAIRDMVNTAISTGETNTGAISAAVDRITATEIVANRADAAAIAVGDRIDEILEGADNSGLTPEEVAANKLVRDGNTARGNQNASDILVIQGDITELKRVQGEQGTDITAADDAARTAQQTADDNTSAVNGAVMRVGANEAAISNHKTQDFDPLAVRVGEAETAIGTEGPGLNDGTGILGDIKGIKRNVEVNTEEAAAIRVIAERADQREVGDSTTISDFLVRQGVTEAQDPGVDYRGTGDQDYFDANQATIPGLLQDMATGSFTIPAVVLDGVEAGTRFKWTGALLFAGLRGTTTGFPPSFWYVIEQGVNRIEGAGAVDSTSDIANDWVRATGDASSFTELRSGNTVTGTDIVVRWAALYGGVDATIRPRLTAGRVDFTGQFEPAVEGIVENTVRGDLDALGYRIDLNEGGIAANAVHRVADKAQLDAQGDLLTSVHDTLAEPQFQAIEHASVVPVDKETLDATPLNTTLGGGTAPFATILDGAIEQQTQFITRMTSANQVLSYGAGRVADVFAGRVRIFVLVPGRDASVRTETRYFTTRDGFGTRSQPAVLEFGNGANPPRAADNEVFLTEGIPAVGAEITNISMAFAVRTNDSWAGIPNTIQFTAPRSGEVRTFPVPGVTNVVFTATALENGQIVGRVTHPGGGDPNQLVTNGGAIRFDAAYVETIRTEARDPGQTTVDGGAFTGGNIIAMDVGATGDSATATMQIVTPNGTYDSGYFRSEAHRNDFEARNDGFRAFVSNR